MPFKNALLDKLGDAYINGMYRNVNALAEIAGKPFPDPRVYGRGAEFVPGVGDAIGLGQDVRGYMEHPNSLTPWAGLLSLAAVVPGIPRKPKILSRSEFSALSDDALDAYTKELKPYVEQLRKMWDAAPPRSLEKADLYKQLNEASDALIDPLTLASHRSASKDLTGGWTKHELARDLGEWVREKKYLGPPGLNRIKMNRTGPKSNRMPKEDAIKILESANPAKNLEVKFELDRWREIKD